MKAQLSIFHFQKKQKIIELETDVALQFQHKTTRRLDCPAFLLTAEETGQTKRRDMHLDGGALNVRF